MLPQILEYSISLLAGRSSGKKADEFVTFQLVILGHTVTHDGLDSGFIRLHNISCTPSDEMNAALGVDDIINGIQVEHPVESLSSRLCQPSLSHQLGGSRIFVIVGGFGCDNVTIFEPELGKDFAVVGLLDISARGKSKLDKLGGGI